MKKKLINIIFLLFIMILLGASIFINKDYNIILNKKIINNEQELIKYKDYKFVTLNLKKSTETRFSLSDNDHNSTIYTITYDNKTILLELSEHTVNTGNVDVMYMKDSGNTNMLKNNIEEESEKDINFVNGYYTNVNYKDNADIINIKFYITIGLCFISLLIMIIEFIGLLTNRKREDF